MDIKEVKKILESNIYTHHESFGNSGNVLMVDFDAEKAAAQICQLFESEIENLFKEIESNSHPMNTNMYGISLSRGGWQAIKDKYLKRQEKAEISFKKVRG